MIAAGFRRRAAALGLAIATVATVLAVASEPARAACGTYRWDVQTARDAPGQIDPSVRQTTVDRLRARTRPDGITATTARIVGTETHVFQVRGRIVRATRTSDGEIEAIVARRDNLHRRFAVRFHDPSCVVGSSLETAQGDARRSFTHACGSLPLDTPTAMKGIVRVAGVGFWGTQAGDRMEAASAIELNPVVAFAGECWQTSRRFVAMAVGDSVPSRLMAPLAKDQGWLGVKAGVGGCPASGEEPVNLDGQSWTTEIDCRALVRHRQKKVLRTYHPDIVLWWDRQSTSHFLDLAGDLVVSDSSRFWQRRRRTLDDRVRFLSSGGATVVLVGTEPVSLGIGHPAATTWAHFMVHRYFRVTVKWNHILRRYARAHPARATFISVTSAVCHGLTSPCDDTVHGVYARPLGQHYEGPGVPLVVGTLAERLAPLVRRLTP